MEKKDARMGYRLDDKRLFKGNPHPDKDKIVNYLRSGELEGQTSFRDPVTGQWEGLNIWTDGEWEWDDLLIESIQFSNWKIDDSFLQHMKDNNWEVPELDIGENEEIQIGFESEYFPVDKK